VRKGKEEGRRKKEEGKRKKEKGKRKKEEGRRHGAGVGSRVRAGAVGRRESRL
jgi:hypothetical protein